MERPEEVKKNLKEMKDVVVPMAITSWKSQNAALGTMIASWKELREAVKTGKEERKLLRYFSNRLRLPWSQSCIRFLTAVKAVA